MEKVARFKRWNPPATDKQLQLLVDLGYSEEEIASIDKLAATELIDSLINQPTPAQKLFLRGLGVPDLAVKGLFKRQATEVIARLAADRGAEHE